MTDVLNPTHSYDLKKAAEFHGHVCPGLVFGLRAAKAALEELGPRALDEELVAIVENDSCAVDAIQAITGCTFGKGNLIFRDYGKQVYTFFNRTTGKSVRIAIDFRKNESPEDSGMWERYKKGDRSPEVIEAVARIKAEKVRAILESPDDLIMRKSEALETLPHTARIYPSARCSACGEAVMEPRARLRDGLPVCIPCASR